MASEITVTVSLSGYKPAVMTSAISRSISAAVFNMTGNYVQQGVQLIATSATALNLGAVTAPHWAYFKNLDASNFLKIRNGASGADFIELLAGEGGVFPLLHTGTPYAIADTAACLLEYLIFSL